MNVTIAIIYTFYDFKSNLGFSAVGGMVLGQPPCTTIVGANLLAYI